MRIIDVHAHYAKSRRRHPIRSKTEQKRLSEIVSKVPKREWNAETLDDIFKEPNERSLYSQALEARHRVVIRHELILGEADISIVSAGKSLRGNLEGEDETIEACKKYDRLYMYAVLHPVKEEGWEKVRKVIEFEKVVGIKIHPFAGQYDVEKYGDKIWSFAHEHDLPILSHGFYSDSEPWSPAIPISPWLQTVTNPERIIRVANKYPGVKTIIAHVGFSTKEPKQTAEYTEIFKEIKHENIHFDTSSLVSTYNGMLEWFVDELGSERILFGSDAPVHNFSAMCERIRVADIPFRDRQNIYHKNAERIFNL